MSSLQVWEEEIVPLTIARGIQSPLLLPWGFRENYAEVRARNQQAKYKLLSWLKNSMWVPKVKHRFPF